MTYEHVARRGIRGGWTGRTGCTLFASAALALTLAVGCPGDPQDDDDDSSPPDATLDLDADTDRDGALTADEAEDVDEDLAPGAVVRTNVDDDNSDATADCEAEAGSDEDDLAPLLLHAAALEQLEDGEQVALLLDGDVEHLRVMLEDEVVLGVVTSADVVMETTLPDPEDGEPDLRVEGLEFGASATLSAVILDADGEELERDEVALSTPPFTMFSNLDPGDTLYVLDDGSWNLLFREGLADALGADVIVEIDGATYGHDVWIQDEIEFAYQQTPEGSMPLVLDSIRDRPLDSFPESELLAPGFGHLVRGAGPANSLDSFGNLDCTPPITVDGVDYPFGRIYYGGKPGGTQVAAGLRDFLAAQGLQSPLEIDSTWLLVGHVDEFMAFVPDPSSDKGFKLLITDWGVTVEILESLDPRMALPRFDDDYGIATVGDLLESTVPAYNEDVQTMYVDPQRAEIMEVFGLDEADIIPVPSVFERVWNAAVSLVPDMVNLAVYDDMLLIADPHFRTPDEDVDGNGEMTTWAEDINSNGVFDTDEDADGDGVLDEGEDINGNGLLDTEEDRNGNWMLDEGEDFDGDGLLDTFRDPFRMYMDDHMPEALTLVFLDDWNDYHLMEGEVHCGTNILRVPRSDISWWEVQ